MSLSTDFSEAILPILRALVKIEKYKT